MYHLIRYIRVTNPEELPIPHMFPTSPSPESILKVQISRFVPDSMGSAIIADLLLEGKLGVVKQMARTFASLWDLPVPEPRKLIGEAIVSPD